MPGIGPWTADYVRMRVTGDPDVFLPGDVAVRAGAAAAGIPSDAAALTAWAAPHRAVALVPDRSPLARRAACRSHHPPLEGDLLMTATIQTIDTPDGAFTIVADDRGRVLASGWTADPEAALIRIHPRLRPESVADGETDAAAAALAFYGGDIGAIDAVEVAQTGTAMQTAGWSALRRIAAGRPLSYAEFAAALGQPTRGSGRGIHLRPQRARAVRAVPSRAALGRLARRLRVGTRREAQPARPRGGRLTELRAS